jgi:chromosome segregation ATPase
VSERPALNWEKQIATAVAEILNTRLSPIVTEIEGLKRKTSMLETIAEKTSTELVTNVIKSSMEYAISVLARRESENYENLKNLVQTLLEEIKKQNESLKKHLDAMTEVVSKVGVNTSLPQELKEFLARVVEEQSKIKDSVTSLEATIKNAPADFGDATKKMETLNMAVNFLKGDIESIKAKLDALDKNMSTVLSQITETLGKTREVTPEGSIPLGEVLEADKVREYRPRKKRKQPSPEELMEELGGEVGETGGEV